MAAVATVSSCVPPTLPECDDYDAAVLVDMRCYIADLPNSTTARGTTSSGLPIQVTFHAARPPLLSHLCVHCPDLVLKSKPRVVATNADLVLLRVPIDPSFTLDIRYWDYFLYRPRSHRLDLLPNPHPRSFFDTDTALLSREDGGWFAVAALSIWGPMHKRNSDLLVKWDFDLHLYRSDDSKGWISKRVSLKEFVRDTLVPLPDAVDRLYHETGKTIVVDDERGTVAWVDLWRGLFLCDVLEERPVLRDLPLPEPRRGNWARLLEQWIPNPNFLRDVTINRHKDCIKYIEMEIWEPRVVKTMPDSYLEWVRHNNKKSQVIAPGGWKATTWTMPIPVGSFADWHPDCEVESKDVTLDASDPHHSDMLSKLISNNTLQELAHPTISMDDDVVYLLSRTAPRNMRKVELVAAIDSRKKILRGVAELDVQKDFIFMPSYFTSDICRYLRKSTCTKEELKQTEKEAIKATYEEEGKPTELYVKGPSRKKYVQRVWRPVNLLDATRSPTNSSTVRVHAAQGVRSEPEQSKAPSASVRIVEKIREWQTIVFLYILLSVNHLFLLYFFKCNH